MKKNRNQQSSNVLKLREQVESRRLQIESLRLEQQVKLLESVTDSVMGTPVNFEEIYGFRGQPLMPIFYRDLYQSKTTTLRVLQDYDRARNLARYAYETNPNAQAVINGFRSYVVAGGYDVAVTPKKKKSKTAAADESAIDDTAQQESESAQNIIDEFIEANELIQARDGCPVYRETFTRAHKEGDVFLRLFPQEFGPTKVRFVEPDNIRPPQGANWEGPWSFGILTAGDPNSYGDNIAWDTQDPRGYNLNYPLVNRDEVVPPQFIFHLKMNVNKNQKRGVSSLYAVDEDLRGTQKLRYAAREGAKIRASIPYVREHAQADQSAIQTLQAGVQTAAAKRNDSNGGSYEVSVQQIEPGSVHDIPESLQMKPPPADPNADAVERNLKHGLETIAARFNAPAWLVGGASNDSSYSSSLTSESPFLRTVLEQQAIQTGYWSAVFRAILEIAIEQGRLGEGALERLHVVVKAQNPQARNKKEEADTNKVLHDEKVISLQTWTADAGHDFDEEQARITEEDEQGLGKQLPVLGKGDNPDNDDSIDGQKQPETTGGMRQREEGYAEAAVAGYAIGLAEAATILETETALNV